MKYYKFCTDEKYVYAFSTFDVIPETIIWGKKGKKDILPKISIIVIGKQAKQYPQYYKEITLQEFEHLMMEAL